MPSRRAHDRTIDLSSLPGAGDLCAGRREEDYSRQAECDCQSDVPMRPMRMGNHGGFLMITHYPSIYNLGHKAISELLLDPVLVEEKIDGSQFSFGKIDGQVWCRSKGAVINHLAPDKMFTPAVKEALERSHLLDEGVVFRCEYLMRPKHNALAYDRIPNAHLIVFDIELPGQNFLDYEEKTVVAGRLGLETVPILYRGLIDDIQIFRSLLETPSCLGGQKIEGVVIKNYIRFGLDKKPLMGKFVSEAFKEVHRKEWGTGEPKKSFIQHLIEQYRTPTRWAKAVQHLNDLGGLEHAPRDIPLIIKEVQSDVMNDCEAEIRDALWAWAWPQLSRALPSRMAEWYKERLLERQFNVEPIPD